MGGKNEDGVRMNRRGRKKDEEEEISRSRPRCCARRSDHVL
jgi:hypothetical protein